jgi:hypothetical protein
VSGTNVLAYFTTALVTNKTFLTLSPGGELFLELLVHLTGQLTKVKTFTLVSHIFRLAVECSINYANAAFQHLEPQKFECFENNVFLNFT